MTMDTLFTFHDLIQRVVPGFDSSRWKVVRHLENSREAPDFGDLILTERSTVEFYQCFQGSDLFGNCDGIFSFVGLPSSRALFFGAYLRVGDGTSVRLQSDNPSVPASIKPLWQRWCRDQKPGASSFQYSLERDDRFAPLEGRVIIDWGAGALAWHQWKSDKPVVEIRESGQVAPCPQYPDIDVSLQKIAFLSENEASNPSWVTRLGSVGGIYLLTDHRNDRLYVGQAGAEGIAGGFWARWKQYAAGNSGNKLVDAAVSDGSIRVADPEVTLSVLEVIPLGRASKARLDELENRWKKRLRSRHSKHGLNDN
jgi:hypothetical protein